MKITAYEVRPDEKDYLLAAAQQEQIEITLVQGPMTQDNIDRAEGADGITIRKKIFTKICKRNMFPPWLFLPHLK